MLFTVIIPIYNSEKTIARCLESVSVQEYNDYEVLMIDDGSSDGGPEICRRFAEKDPRFRYLRQENAGVSAARNQGIREAAGEFLAFLDSDDRYCPSYLSTFRQMILENPEYDHFWCGYRTVSDDPEDNGMVAKLKDEGRIVLSDRRKIMSLFESDLLASPVNKAYRAEVIKKHELHMRIGLSLGEDLLFNLDYLEHAPNTKILIYNDALYEYYCFTSESLNHKYRKDLKEIYGELIEGFSSHIFHWDLDPGQTSKYYSAVYRMDLRAMRNCFRPENTDPQREKTRFCNDILRSEEFKEAVKHASCRINPLYRAAYATGSFTAVRLVDSLSAAKQSFASRKG